MLRDELQRKVKGQAASVDPRRCLVDDLLETFLARYRTEGRRSVGRAELSCRHLLRVFAGVPAVRVTGADVTRYADLRVQEGAAAAGRGGNAHAARRTHHPDYGSRRSCARPPLLAECVAVPLSSVPFGRPDRCFPLEVALSVAECTVVVAEWTTW
jgi:hypothetical protein